VAIVSITGKRIPQLVAASWAPAHSAGVEPLSYQALRRPIQAGTVAFWRFALMLKLRYVPVVLLLTLSAPDPQLHILAGQLWSWITSWTIDAGCGMDPNGINCG
jgi:hypothetical protein